MVGKYGVCIENSDKTRPDRVLTNKQKQTVKRKRKHLTTRYFLPYALLMSSL
jgi:hypothetical protein